MHRDLSNFAPGLDTRRSIMTSQPGVLQVLQDAVVNQGAEIDKRLAFVDLGALPAGTFGVESITGGLITFGSEANPGGLPTNTSYQQLSHPNGATAMAKVLCSCSFGGSAFVIAQFATGEIFMYWDGEIIPASVNGKVITGFSTNQEIATQLANFIATISGLAIGPVTSSGGGVYSFLMWSTSSLPYTPILSTNSANTGTGTIAAVNVSTFITGIIAASASTSFLVTGGSFGGAGKVTSIAISVDNGVTWKEVLGQTISYGGNIVTTSQMAESIAEQMDSFISTQNITTSSNNNTVTVTYSSQLGATPNGYQIRITGSGDFCVDNCIMDFSQNTGSVSGIGCSSVMVCIAVNLVAGHSYSGAGAYVQATTIGHYYYWAKNSSDTSLTNGSQTLNISGIFLAQGASVTLNGTASVPVTAVVCGFQEILGSTVTGAASLPSWLIAIAAAIRAYCLANNLNFTAFANTSNQIVISRLVASSLAVYEPGIVATMSSGILIDGSTGNTITEPLLNLQFNPSVVSQTLVNLGVATCQAVVNGGTGPYTYSWVPSTTLTTGDHYQTGGVNGYGIVLAGTNTNVVSVRVNFYGDITTGTPFNLIGSFTVTVTDALGQTVVETVQFLLNI